MPEDLASLMGTAVAAIGRPVLVVLDTLEVLRGRGETHPVRLFQWLDALLAKGVMPMRVLGASRGDALQGLPEVSETSARRVPTWVSKYRVLPLPRLEDAAAEALLRKLSVPTALFEELLKIAQGNPLKLRLAAEIAKRTGIDKLPPRRRGAAVDAAFLYRFLLSRVEDPELRKLAHPGLIVRRINAALIREVLAPKLRLGSISEARAQALLDQLAAHHWLVEVDPGTGFLKHRSDMRRLLLPLLYRSEPAKAARIDAAVIPWFASSGSRGRRTRRFITNCSSPDGARLRRASRATWPRSSMTTCWTSYLRPLQILCGQREASARADCAERSPAWASRMTQA